MIHRQITHSIIGDYKKHKGKLHRIRQAAGNADQFSSKGGQLASFHVLQENGYGKLTNMAKNPTFGELVEASLDEKGMTCPAAMLRI